MNQIKFAHKFLKLKNIRTDNPFQSLLDSIKIEPYSKTKFYFGKPETESQKILAQYKKELEQDGNTEKLEKLLEIAKFFKSSDILKTNFLLIGQGRIGKSLNLQNRYEKNLIKIKNYDSMFLELSKRNPKFLNKFINRKAAYSSFYINEEEIFKILSSEKSIIDLVKNYRILYLEDLFSQLNWNLNPDREKDNIVERELKNFYSYLIKSKHIVCADSNNHPVKVVKNTQILGRVLDIFKEKNIKYL